MYMGIGPSNCGGRRHGRAGVAYNPRMYSGAYSVGPRGGMYSVAPNGRRSRRGLASLLGGYGGLGYPAQRRRSSRRRVTMW